MKTLLMIAALFLMGCSVVGPQQRGLRISLGSVSDEVKSPGPYLWVPFMVGMKKIDVSVQKSEIEGSAASRDMQEVTTHLAVNWSMNTETLIQTYKSIGDEDDVLNRILIPAVQEVVKASISKRTAEECLTKRTEIKVDIDEALRARLARSGISLTDVSIIDFQFSKGFTNAIESKQIAEQQAKQAEYVALKAVQEARAEVNRAKGTAEAQALLKSTLTKEMLEKMAIDKWNGSLPTYVTGNSVPFINLKSVQQ